MKASVSYKEWRARKATCLSGHSHDSRLEATVCDRLSVAYGLDKPQRVIRRVRFPLIASCAAGERPLCMTVDFVVVEGQSKVVRVLDAKGRKSREWARGKAALEATLGVKVEEVKE